ncbi:MAG TPA: glycosyltransferase family 4 protein [Chitinophagaceae bacterium]
MPKLIRVTTIPLALHTLLKGQMRYMKDNGFEVIMVSADGKEREEVVRNEGCPHVIIPMTRKITPFADLKSLWKLYRFFKKEKPDIVHSHTPKAGLLSMIAAKMAGVKIRIHTIAGLRFMTSKGFTRKLLVQMEKLTASSATHVWPNSYSLLQYVTDNKLAQIAKLKVIGHGSSNGIDVRRFSTNALQPAKLEEIKKELKYDESLTYLLSVGRIVKDKGIDELLKAFQQLQQQFPATRLVLLGSFEEDLDPVSDEAKKILQQHPAIIHINWSDAVEYYMHLASVLVHPSYREGFPNVLLQAGSMGCPICCSIIEGNVDIVTHNETGLLFKKMDADDLFQKLEWAMQNPGKMKGFAAELEKKVKQYFDRQFVQHALKEEYVGLLNA